MDRVADSDPIETREWREALGSVLAFEGAERAQFLLGELMQAARASGAAVPYSASTPYLNTIPPERETPHPGDRAIEHKIRSYIRWNALAIVLRANKTSSELGGHIASFQSSALLYDTGFMHFWHAPSEGHGGDLRRRIQGEQPGAFVMADGQCAAHVGHGQVRDLLVEPGAEGGDQHAEHADHDAQDQDLALLVGQGLQKLVHPARGVGLQCHLLGSRLERVPLRHLIGGLGAITAGGAVSVGDLVGSDAVHEGQEGATLILVARQRLDGGQANLLSDVVS